MAFAAHRASHGYPSRTAGVRRETAGAYLKAAGIAVRPPGAWGRRSPAKPANEVTPTLARLPGAKDLLSTIPIDPPVPVNRIAD
jgi:hypothetical protein